MLQFKMQRAMNNARLRKISFASIGTRLYCWDMIFGQYSRVFCLLVKLKGKEFCLQNKRRYYTMTAAFKNRAVYCENIAKLE